MVCRSSHSDRYGQSYGHLTARPISIIYLGIAQVQVERWDAHWLADQPSATALRGGVEVCWSIPAIVTLTFPDLSLTFGNRFLDFPKSYLFCRFLLFV